VKVLFLIDLLMKYLPGSSHNYVFLYLCFDYLNFKFLVVTGSLIEDPLSEPSLIYYVLISTSSDIFHIVSPFPISSDISISLVIFSFYRIFSILLFIFNIVACFPYISS
jgi:hypothetical protein